MIRQPRFIVEDRNGVRPFTSHVAASIMLAALRLKALMHFEFPDVEMRRASDQWRRLSR